MSRTVRSKPMPRQHWTPEEIQKLQKFIDAGIGPKEASRSFPDRHPENVSTRMRIMKNPERYDLSIKNQKRRYARFGVELSDDMFKWVEAESDRLDVPKIEIIRRALKLYRKTQESKK